MNSSVSKNAPRSGAGIASVDSAVRISDVPRYWAAASPDAPALFENDRPVSYAALWKAITDASHMLADRGVGAGDRIMLVSENCTAQIALLFAASELQAWPVIVNARLSEREIEAIRVHCEPRVMAFTTGVSPDARAHAARYHAAETTSDSLGTLAFSAADPAVKAEPPEIASQVAALIYTSGTTGAPKGVMVGHRGLLHFAAISGESRNLNPSDCAYGVLPISHIFGLATMLMATLHAGAALYMHPRFTPEDTLNVLANRGVSMLQGVPTMFTRLMSYIKENGIKVQAPKLRYLYTGGAALDPTLKREVEETFGLPLHHGYGLTEYAGSLFITSFHAPRSDCSAGYIVAGAEIRLVDHQGNDVPAGEAGELWVRGAGLMLGYYRAPDLTEQVMRPGGWYNTGDIARLDPDGALFIVGRTKDLIIRSGFNVYPIEVESVINSYPGVKLSAVVGRPAADMNEEVVAFVELYPGASLDVADLRAYLKTRLSPYKQPAAIVTVPTIPTTASGKILKKDLRSQAVDAK